jgi:hypothetical protein
MNFLSTALKLANKSFKDIPYIEEDHVNDLKDGDPSKFLTNMNKLVSGVNHLSKYLSFDKNFPGSTLELSFSAGETKTISHLLGVRPKYRIILRQEGNGVLSDIPSSWNDKVAVIVNNGAVTVNATIMFLKE